MQVIGTFENRNTLEKQIKKVHCLISKKLLFVFPLRFSYFTIGSICRFQSTIMKTSSDYSNQALYGIKSDPVRYTWATYCIFVLLSSLIGDTIILVSSIKYKAFELPKVTVAIIQHLAVCDLITAATFVAPRMLSLLSGRQIFGRTLCYMNPYISYYLSAVAVFLICVMTFYKLFQVKYPFKANRLTLKKVHMTAAIAWLFSSIMPIVFLIVDKKDVSFDFRSYVCDYHMSSEIWNWLTLLISMIFIGIPTCVVTVNTIMILIIAKRSACRHGGRLRREGVMTTVLTATVYCISVLPYAVYRIGEQYVNASNDHHGFFQRHYFKIAQSFVLLNTISNFYIYCLTLSSFRDFLWSGLKLQRRTPHNHGNRLYFEEKREILG